MSSTEFLYALLRLQFGLSAGFHFLFVPLSIGLLLCLNVLQTCYVRTGRIRYLHAARVWRRFFLLAWAVGLCTGYPLRWQLQENWANYAQTASPVLTAIFSVEGTIGPLMLACVALTVWGRRMLSDRVHMLVGWALLALLMAQAFTILAVNAWMQHPVGVSFEAGVWRLQSLRAILLNDMALHKVWHTLSAAMLAGAVFVMAVSAAMVVHKRHLDVAAAGMRVGAWVGLFGVVSVLWSGHMSAVGVAEDQPMKFAAFEAHWRQDEGASPLVLFALPDEARGINRHAVQVPYLLSLLSVGTLASPPGIEDLGKRYEQRLAYALSVPDDPRHKGWLMLYKAASQREPEAWAAWTPQERIAHVARMARPAVAPLFWSFRVMVTSGLLLLALCIAAFVKREDLASGRARGMLLLVRCGAPLPWVAILSGWAVAEMGRQPWTVYEQLPTFHAMQAPSLAHAVSQSFMMFVAALSIAALFVLAGRAIYHAGPQARRPHGRRHHWQGGPMSTHQPTAV
ncbi:MAG: cytochrome ubiquinol oxidase subunit I [Aquabacterium sp.]